MKGLIGDLHNLFNANWESREQFRKQQQTDGTEYANRMMHYYDGRADAIGWVLFMLTGENPYTTAVNNLNNQG